MGNTGARQLVAAVAACAALVVAGCTGTPPESPVQALPKMLVDFVNNTSSIYITSINADWRYANLSVVLHNANLSGPLTFEENNSYALVARTNLTYFVINASADDGSKFYYYNTTMNIVEVPRTSPTARATWQIYIQDTPNGPTQQQALPFKHLLEEGRR